MLDRTTCYTSPLPVDTRLSEACVIFPFATFRGVDESAQTFPAEMPPLLPVARCCRYLPICTPTNRLDRKTTQTCWCGETPDLTKHGEVLAIDECDMACSGTTDGENCGGRNKMTVYQLV